MNEFCFKNTKNNKKIDTSIGKSCENKTDPVTVSSFRKNGCSSNFQITETESIYMLNLKSAWHMHTLSPSCLALSLSELSRQEEVVGERRFWSEQSLDPHGRLPQVSCLSGNGIVFPKSLIAGSFDPNIFVCLTTQILSLF